MFVDAHRARFGVAPICRALSQHGVPIASSTYYAARHRPRSAKSIADEAILIEVTWVHSDPTIGRGQYGARKVWHQLRREGTAVGRCRVERLMRTAGLQGVRRGKAFVITKADPAATRSLDLVGVHHVRLRCLQQPDRGGPAQGGGLGDVTALADASVGVCGGLHTLLGSFAMAARTLGLVAYPTEYSKGAARLCCPAR